jgi:hypothetical protein
METKINMYIEPIMAKKKKHDFKAWRKMRKLTKSIDKTSPSFDMMVEMHEFLILLRDIYMYDNNDKFHLFIGTIPKGCDPRRTAAMIYRENGFSITYVLMKTGEGKQINIEIIRNAQNRKDVERIQFYDGEYEFKDEYDQEKMLFIISCLMHGVQELIIHYYKNKKL